MLSLFTLEPIVLFDILENHDFGEWYILDDRVMGGRSNGEFELNANKILRYSGNVSTENNGGFSSIRYRFDPIDMTKRTKIQVKLKGDGKNYQFRLKASANDRHSYVTSFETSGEWETIELNIEDFYPSFRGRTLDMPNFDQVKLEEISFLIGNKINESFEIQIETMSVL